MKNLNQATTDGCRHLGIHLIRGNFQDSFVPCNLITGLFQPLEHGRLCNTFTHFGHNQFKSSHEANLGSFGANRGFFINRLTT